MSGLLFLYFTPVKEQEEIKKIQEELNILKGEMILQGEKIEALQRRLLSLTNPDTAVFKATSIKSNNDSWKLENFIGLRLIHFIGIIVLVTGLSIGVKYAIDRDLISENLRILLAYSAGVILYLFSLWLREKYTLFSAILFSGGMASLYFTTYGAHVYYNMFSFGLAFGIMIVLTLFTCWQAIQYNRQEIAILGLVGAYGIPFLISKNTGQIELFFLYITLINAGVAFLCVKKQWKQVARIGQFISWILFISWAAMRYMAQEQKAVALVFMSVFFLLFLFTTLSSKLVHKKLLTINETYQHILHNLALYISALFVFGFSLLTNMATDLAMITIVIAVFIALQAIVIYQYWKEEVFTIRMMSSFALSLLILFIAFNWSGFIVTLLWLLTAVIVFTWGLVRRSVSARMMSIIVFALTLGKLLVLDSLTFTTVQKVIAYVILGILLLVVSFFYQKFRQQLFSDEKSMMNDQ
jgi:uncharacterized membrane protein